MLETYKMEVTRKRKAARIFWLIVLVCSIFLYYFFQGYYPDIRVGLRLLSEPSNENFSNSTHLMRSFGIIKVRTTQPDTTMLLNGGLYGNTEERMSDYGEYTMEIEKSGYIKNILKFKIDIEKKIYEEKISLLPHPIYEKLDTILAYYPLGNGESLIKTASGIILPELSLNNEVTVVYTGSLDHIGGKYFQTNTGIVSWEGDTFQKTNQEITNFIQTCQNIQWKSNLFYCPKSKSILTEGGKYMTGILDLQDNILAKSGALIEVKNGILGKTYSQTGEIRIHNFAILNDVLFVKNSGSLMAKNSKDNKIVTSLDTIEYVTLLGEDTILIGQKKGQMHLIVRHSSDPIDRERDIILPENISYRNIILHSYKGNLMLEGKNGILFVYRSGDIVHWIVEGDIIAYNNTGAIYKKNGEFWKTDWSEKL